MMSDLKQLREKQEEILKAELAAWLHDVGKFCNLHLESHTGGHRRWGNGGSYKVVVNDPRVILHPTRSNNWIRRQLGGRLLQILQNQRPTFYSEFDRLTSKGPQLEACLLGWNVDIPGLDSFSVAELILLGLPGAAQPSQIQACFSKNGWLSAALGIAHSVAHHDKQEGDGPQCWPDVFWATAFGFENLVFNLDNLLQQFPFPCHITQVKKYVIHYFPYGLGDTRRPVNEITLLDWAWTVSGLYKTSVAYAVLKAPLQIRDKQNHSLQWRLLSIRTNGLEYLLSASSIPDLKARQKLLVDAWDRVRDLLEEEYPLALEVYRDENGPVFVVPDIENLLGLTDSDRNNQTLRELILEGFRQGTVQNDPCLAIYGEIMPIFKLDSNPWKGQPAPQELPPIEEHVCDEAASSFQSDPQWVAAQWCNFPKPQERCTICGLRPQGPSDRARDRKMCDVCEKRRSGRAKQWATKELYTTIWIDEVADENGRIALIVGKFDLEHWLSGILVRSLAVRTPNDQNGHAAEDVAKNPSFARLRRIWETTRKFWQDVAPTDKEGFLEKSLAGEVIKEKRPRIFLKGTVEPKDRVFPYHAYELEIQGRKVAVLWVPENANSSYRGGFWVIENLKYLDNVYGQPFRELVRLLAGQTLRVYEPTGYGRPGKEQVSFTIQQDGIHYLEDNYIPFIPILAEPRTFMALVPADKAFEVVKAIKAKYEREMGKVRNRLPLHLGVVFADSHQPLRIILDAGRRMLKQKAKPVIWEVRCPARKQAERDPLPDRFSLDKEGQFKEWMEIILETEDRQVTWFVPAVMGDGQTEDHWYPYVYLATSDEPTDRNRYYKTDLGNPWNPDHPWLVHAAELKPGDIVYFTPATFDFIWLAHPGNRFRIAYDGNGRRFGTLHRPYLLDELEDLEKCWRLLAGEKRKNKDGKQEKSVERLSSNQLHQVRDLIEGKRAEWFENPESSVQDPTFRNFCEDVLRNAEWTDEPTKVELKSLTQWAVNGLLADAVELFYHIMKKRPLKDDQG